MRKVNRGDIPTPTKLANLHSNNQELLNEVELIRNNNGKAKGNIYGDVTVKNSLISLYKNICFLCQIDVTAGFDVEHFLPWSKYHPERAYDWNNLHQSCKQCNNRKKRKIYKILDSEETKKVNDIILLDPSIDDVEQLITFDPDTCKAISNTNTDNKSNLTAIFLNDLECLSLRKDHYIKLTKLLMSQEWFDTFCQLKSDFKDYSNIILDFTNEVDSEVGTLCYRLVFGYFSINKEYNVFMQRIFFDNTQIDIALINKYAAEYCQHHGKPFPIIG